MLWRCPMNELQLKLCNFFPKNKDFLRKTWRISDSFHPVRHQWSVTKNKTAIYIGCTYYLESDWLRTYSSLWESHNLQFQILDESLSYMKGVVSKETVVLRRWGSSIQKFGFINGVDNVNWPPYRDSKSWRFERYVALRQSESKLYALCILGQRHQTRSTLSIFFCF